MTHEYQLMLDWIDDQRPEMVDRILEWSSLCSGSEYPAGLDAMCSKLEAAFHTLSPSAPGVGAADHRRPATGNAQSKPPFASIVGGRAPTRVLLAGHFDTVFDPQDAFAGRVAGGGKHFARSGCGGHEGRPRRDAYSADGLRGPRPGSAARPAGLGDISQPGRGDRLAVFRDFNSEKSARRNHLGLLFEPALPGGKLASSRKGSGNFVATIRGRAAHAGRDPGQGRNAIRAAADFVQAIDELNARREGIFINVARIGGGGALNIVPDAVAVRYNVRTLRADDEDWILEEVESIAEQINARDGIHILVAGEFASPPKPATPTTNLMLEDLAACAHELGFALDWEATGGACDGNKLAAAGLPNIDNLGPRGGGLHSADEHVFIDSLTERAKLTALYLCRVASGAAQFPGNGVTMP